jgi:uncharacterized protein (DUF362 family)
MNKKIHPGKKNSYSRRKFITSLSTTAGIAMLTFGKGNGLLARYSGDHSEGHSDYQAKVAVTRADNYNREGIRNKVQHLFDSLGGIDDVIKTSDKIAIKINLTGGSETQNNSRLKGADLRDTVWTHPEVLRAVCELLIDYGVTAGNIFIVEALWDQASFDDFGYREVMNELGTQFIDLNKPDPYPDFVNIPTGENKFFYDSFVMNPILKEVDCYISIPKMKHHYSAGATHSIKNQIGAVPLSKYNMNGQSGSRASLHSEGGSTGTHLPHSIADLYLARPVDLAINDGIKNSINGEGPWIDGYENAEFGLLLAGKDAIALDAVSTYQMGVDPEGSTLRLPNGSSCLNYMQLLSNLGYGTNRMSEIELVGDGADAIVSLIPDRERITPAGFSLSQNYPNPFDRSTTFLYHLPASEHVIIKIMDAKGQEVETLINSIQTAGSYEITWKPLGDAGGIFYCIMQAGNFHKSVKLMLVR